MNNNTYSFIAILVASILVLSKTGYSQDTGNTLFDNSFLHEIRIESDSVNDGKLWDSFSFSYEMVNIIVDGVTVDSVGIRFKGLTSASSPQKPLKIDINEYVDGKKFEGLKKFNLHNNFEDEFLQRDALAYELYRRAGLPAPRTSYAEVYVGNVFKGVYTITEQIDKTFIGDRFPSKNGSLVKGAFGSIIPPPINIELKEGTFDEYNHFANSANASNIGDFINLRNYLKLLAIDMIIEDFDSYAFHRHNFYIYYETKSERLNFITYDHNYAFDVDQIYDFFYPLGTYPFSENLIEIPVIKEMYEQTMCELLTYLLDHSFVDDYTTHNFNIINTNVNGVIPDNPKKLVEYVSIRKQELLDTLDALGVTCGDLSFPLNPNDIVINEFVASNDIVRDPDGAGTPDWIELYNNSKEDITLNQYFYLSNDSSFPKKWHFPEEVTVPAGEYLIVWADRDVHQQGIHAGFNIEKDGGSLLMTYENNTPLQHINYSTQQPNMGYARIPNGTGDFMIQDYTFKVNNETLSTNNSTIYHVKVYPNPTNNFITIEAADAITEIEIYDFYGRLVKEISKPAFPVDISNLMHGVYILNAYIGNDKINIKLLVQQ